MKKKKLYLHLYYAVIVCASVGGKLHVRNQTFLCKTDLGNEAARNLLIN